MSTGANDPLRRRQHLAAWGFAAILLLSVMWPSPITSINHLCCDARIGADDLSFLGREQPIWDVAFWWLLGLGAIALIRSGEANWKESFRSITIRRPQLSAGKLPGFITCASAAVFCAWRILDAPVLRWVEAVQSENIDLLFRLANRLGGGINPALIVVFFVIAGVVYRDMHWVLRGSRMALSGAAAGTAVQIIKYAVGRSRPELWLGPFHHARIAATSFPSGHTVGAFALAGVVLLEPVSWRSRLLALLLATYVGLARIEVFRHWRSDVLASAAIGLLLAWLATSTIQRA